MKTVALAEVKDQLSKYLDEATHEQIVITRHGKPSGVLIGFETDEDWLEFKLMNDPRFLQRVEQARENIYTSRGIPWEPVPEQTANKRHRRAMLPKRPNHR